MLAYSYKFPSNGGWRDVFEGENNSGSWQITLWATRGTTNYVTVVSDNGITTGFRLPFYGTSNGSSLSTAQFIVKSQAVWLYAESGLTVDVLAVPLPPTALSLCSCD